MSAPFGFDRAAINALGWTLLHFVWQGTLIAMAFAGVDRWLSRGSANLVYVVACGTLLVMLIVPIGTFMVARDAGPPGAPTLGASTATPCAVTSDRGRLAAKPASTVVSAPDRVVPPQPIPS